MRNKINKADAKISKCRTYVEEVDKEIAELSAQLKLLQEARSQRAGKVQSLAKERRALRREYEQAMARVEAQEVLSSDDAEDDDMSVNGAAVIRMARDGACEEHGDTDDGGDDEEFPEAMATPTGAGDSVGRQVPMVVPPPQVVLPPGMAGGQGALVPVLPDALPSAPGLLEAARAKRARSESVRRHGAAPQQQQATSFAALAAAESDG